MAKILIIDDDSEMLESCEDVLSALGHECYTAEDGETAFKILDHQAIDVILCDLFMPKMNGMKVLEKSRQIAPDTPFIMLTAYGTIDRAVESVKAGAFDFLEKPYELERLKITIEKGLRQRQVFMEKTNLQKQLEKKYSFDNIIGKSPQICSAFEMIESVAATDVNVMITGESGTGKELVARSIHSRSLRKMKPFVPVNCGALPENLFESELFGYEKGAFTGALQNKQGIIELANGGTFFLDEVCELSETLQVKLLRVLQDREIMRIGGKQFHKVDVRILSATNCNIEHALAANKLREDLYYRLNVVTIHLPPLREREGDIPLLAEHFLTNLLKQSSKTIHGFSPAAMSHLNNHSWPGNVRELQNVVERAVTLAKGEQIEVADLPPNLISHSAVSDFPAKTFGAQKKQASAEASRHYLISLLEKHRGNITRMAEEADMSRRNLHRLLNQYNLDAKSYRF